MLKDRMLYMSTLDYSFASISEKLEIILSYNKIRYS